VTQNTCKIPEETSTVYNEPKAILRLFPGKTSPDTFKDQICLSITM